MERSRLKRLRTQKKRAGEGETQRLVVAAVPGPLVICQIWESTKVF